MQEEALQRFLASVRCDRLIDYLDPIGETAEEALARRIRWAQMTRNDPAHADEAMFLLQHEKPLRDVLVRELSEDSGWVEGVEPGQEYESSSSWSRDGDGSQVVHEADEEPSVETELPDTFAETGIMRIEDVTLDQIETAPPAPVRESEPNVDDDEGDTSPFEPLPDGPPTIETDSLKPSQMKVAVSSGIKVESNPGGAKDVGVKSPTAGGHMGLLQPRRKVRTASPAGKRVATPTLASLSNPGMSLPDPEEVSEVIEKPVTLDNATPVSAPTPELARAIARAATLADEDEPADEGDTDPVRLDSAERMPRPPPRKTAHDDDEGGIGGYLAVAAVVLLIVLGVGGGYIYSLTNPPVASRAGLDKPTPGPKVAPTPAPPAPAPAPPTPGPDAVTPEPGSPTQPASLDGTAPDPEPTQPDPATQAPDPEAQPDPEPSQPEPQVDPEPTAPDPEPQPDPEPEPQPDPAPAPEPAQPEPTPAPEPAQPEPTPAPEPAQPEPAPAPEPAPDPEPAEPDQVEADAPDLRGMWTGMVGGAGFVLRVQAQTGPAFSGRAEVLQSTGTWARYNVTGSLDVATGNVRFANLAGDVSFTGNIKAGPMSGSMTANGQTDDFEISR